MKKIFLLLALATMALYSCRKEDPIASKGIQLRFSTDTVFLDTVFRAVGSSTYNLKVYNPSDETVVIDDIHLGRNQSSKYRINVNGRSGNAYKEVEILPKDSIHVFIEVTLTELGSFPGMLYTDSILFTNKGTSQNVKLVTLARDAYFHYPTNFLVVSGIPIPYSTLDNSALWDKPHVFYGYGVIQEEINIPPGADLHFHANSGLLILDNGILKVGGTGAAGDSVTFQGDRLEPFYEDAAGQWGGALGGIYISRNSRGNRINNTVIKNATTALRLDSVGAADDQITISNSYILNSSRIGIYGGHGNVVAYNTVVANSGLNLLYAFGGNYQFRHCTFANYWEGGTRSTAAVALSNYIDLRDENDREYRLVRDLQSAYFGNCIVTGSNRQELAILKDDAGQVTYEFRNAIIDIDESIPQSDRSFDIKDSQFFSNILINNDPDFVNIEKNRYNLDSASQAVDQGNNIDGTRTNGIDILGNPRSPDGTPDLGAFERQY